MSAPEGLPPVDDHERMSKYAALVTSQHAPKILVGVPRTLADLMRVDPALCSLEPCVLCGALTYMKRLMLERVHNAGLRSAIVCYPCATSVGLLARVQVPRWQVRDAVAEGADPGDADRVADYHRKDPDG